MSRFQAVIVFAVVDTRSVLDHALGTPLRPSLMGTYSIRVAFSARDGSDAKAVCYELTMSGSSVFVHRPGTTTSGAVSTTFPIRP